MALLLNYFCMGLKQKTHEKKTHRQKRHEFLQLPGFIPDYFLLIIDRFYKIEKHEKMD